MRKPSIKNVMGSAATGVALSLSTVESVFAADGAAQATDFMTNIIKVLINFAGIVAVAMVVWGGIRYATSSGHPEQLDKAKKTLWYAGVGLVIVLAAYSIVDFVSQHAKASFN
jgi:type IV secretory pathway VirB2 component (pilin)